MIYFSEDESGPLPSASTETSHLGLFGAIDMQPGTPIRLSAVGEDPASPGQFLMLGTYVIQAYPGAVTTIALRAPTMATVTPAAGRCTEDALFGGSVVLFQPPRGTGYRTNVDALLLAAFATARKVAPVAFDLGAGVGAVGLSLLPHGAARRVVLVEIDERAASISRRNLEANRWADRGEVVRADVRDVGRSRPGEAALVTCNPPYTLPGRGRVPAAQARARSGEVGVFVEAARQLAGKRARVCFVYPAQELGLLLATLAGEGLHAKRLRFVHGKGDRPARVALVEAQAARPGGLRVLPPLVERAAHGYTPEMQALLANGDVRGDANGDVRGDAPALGGELHHEMAVRWRRCRASHGLPGGPC